MKVGFRIHNSNTLQSYVGGNDTAFYGYDKIRSICSDNTGNILFQYAARKLFLEDVQYLKYEDDPTEFRDKIDILVLPEANLINLELDYSTAADFVEKIDKPTLLLGVGAQGTLTSTPEDFLKIPEGTKRFLLEVSKRTPYILCRGEFTKKILLLLGVVNVKSVGCSTFLLNPKNSLWQEMNRRERGDLFNRLSITEGVYQVSKRSPEIDYAERFLFDFVLSNDSHYIGQEQTSVLRCGFGMHEEIEDEDLYYLRKYLAPHVSKSEFYSIACSRFRSFDRADNWINYARGRTAFCGTRIHGNIVGIQAGIPSLPIVHDSRTSELCDSMKLPHIHISDFFKIRTKFDLLEEYDRIFNANLKELDQYRSSVTEIYIDLLTQIGLTPSKFLYNILL